MKRSIIIIGIAAICLAFGWYLGANEEPTSVFTVSAIVEEGNLRVHCLQGCSWKVQEVKIDPKRTMSFAMNEKEVKLFVLKPPAQAK